MIALAVVYLLAGLTIGRMVYEFDVLAAPGQATITSRRIEIIWCVAVGLFWPIVPLSAVWFQVRRRR